jgi:hypothetical protein
MNKTLEAVSFNFTYEGVEFKSRVLLSSPLFDRIMSLPEGEFASLNKACLAELWEGDLSPENIRVQLERLNESGSHAFIELA